LPVGLAGRPLAPPPEVFQCCGNAVLVGLADPGRLEAQNIHGDLPDGDAADGGEVLADLLLPDVGLVAGGLLRASASMSMVAVFTGQNRRPPDSSRR
jgi:hypothetical protein